MYGIVLSEYEMRCAMTGGVGSLKHQGTARGCTLAALRHRQSLIVVCVMVIAVLTATSTAAQIGTGRLSVHTLVGDDVVLAGAEVVATEVATGYQRRTPTDEQGVALLTSLPPGTYRVEASYEGFQPAVYSGCVLRIGSTARITMTLRPQVSADLEVTDQVPLVDPYRSDSSTNIVPEQMEFLPVPDRAFDRLAFLTPGVQRERWEFLDIRGSPVVGAATNAIGTGYFVDGVEFGDPYFGSARVQLSQDAIREMRVVNNRFDAGIGGASGGAISVVTRSGTNSLHGSVFGFYRADALRARGALELEEVDYSRFHLGFTVGGPLVRDRSHYFVAFEHLDEDDIALVRPGGAFTELAEDVPKPIQRAHVYATLDHRFSDSSTGSATLFWERARQDNYIVGGVIDESHGYSRNNDNWSMALNHSWVLGDNLLNELRLLGGRHELDYPMNSDRVTEYFSTGATLQTGRHLIGEYHHTTDTLQIEDSVSYLGFSNHELRAGFGFQLTRANDSQDRMLTGWLIYLTDDRSLPAYYYYGEGSSAARLDNRVYGLFVQDDWRPAPNLTLGLGLRYDIEDGANNPDFEHPLVNSRRLDTDNLQPRVSVVWNPDGRGRTVLRAGLGRYVSRYPLYPAMYELNYNDVSGRTQFQRVNGLLVCPELGIPLDQCPILDPADPRNTGIPLAPNIELLADDLEAPESWQASVGIDHRLGDTGLVASVEVVAVDGRKEIIFRNTNWAGNACLGAPDPAVDCWIDPSYRWILTRTNEGRSEYRGLTLGLNGTLKRGHLISVWLTLAEKNNLSDLWAGFETPSDNADIEAEWGPSSSSERVRLVASAVFNLPWRLTLAPVVEYGSGQPWTRELGFDANDDAGLGGFNDRAPGVGRNDRDGPTFGQVSLRLTKRIPLGGGDLDLIVECFNLFNTTNYDVNAVDNAEFLLDLSTGAPQYVPNPRFGEYLDTLPPREIQLGLRYSF